jgi:cardiolipin synthase
VFEADLSRSHRITLDQWEQRPLSDRVKETFARMWGYWL